METCGLCGMDTRKQPRIAHSGKCSECGIQLSMIDEQEEGLEEEEE